MWRIENRTPFAAERGWVRDRDGSEIWLVAVKATFDILPDGRTCVSDNQPPVQVAVEYHGEPGKSSIKYESDLVLTKQTTDVIIVGHAYAPGGSTTQMQAGFKIGPLQKLVQVIGDRTWSALGAGAPKAFSKMPLVYERAFGGVDATSKSPGKDWEWRNPVGTGFVVSARNAAGVALPNLEDPENRIRSWDDRPAPAGFGVVASHWQPRVRFAGTYDDHWMKTRQPLLAEDLDDRFFQCAPADQQAPQFLSGGEPVILHNLTPSGRLKFMLPRLYLGFTTHFHGGRKEVHRRRKLHTVILEPDFPRVSLVWHTALPCHFDVQKLERTVVTLKTSLTPQRELIDDPAEADLG
jgi:hypothetical protein